MWFKEIFKNQNIKMQVICNSYNQVQVALIKDNKVFWAMKESFESAVFMAYMNLCNEMELSSEIVI